MIFYVLSGLSIAISIANVIFLNRQTKKRNRFLAARYPDPSIDRGHLFVSAYCLPDEEDWSAEGSKHKTFPNLP